MPIDVPDPDDPGAAVHKPLAGPPPTADDVRGMLAGVIDPELHASIVELGMVDAVGVTADGSVTVKVALTTAGCPLRTQIKQDVESKVRGLPGVTRVVVEYGEMNADQKRLAMQRARWNARENAAPTEVPSTTRVLAVASGKGGVGKSSVTVNVAAALAARGLARMLPQAEMLVVTTPARAAQKVAVRVADMARRSYMKVTGVVENMSELVLADGSRHAVFGRGGGAALADEIGAPLVARIPLEA